MTALTSAGTDIAVVDVQWSLWPGPSRFDRSDAAHFDPRDPDLVARVDTGRAGEVGGDRLRREVPVVRISTAAAVSRRQQGSVPRQPSALSRRNLVGDFIMNPPEWRCTGTGTPRAARHCQAVARCRRRAGTRRRSRGTAG